MLSPSRRALGAVLGLLVAGAVVRAASSAAPLKRCGGTWTRIDTVSDCGACGVRCGDAHAAPSCVAGRCVLACEEGHADCDDHPGNGCEADLRTSSADCGLCGRSCGGASCVDGHCAARFVGPGVQIAADDAAVYALGPVVTRYPLDGSETTLIAEDGGGIPALARGEDGRVRDAAFVYWAEPVAGGAVVKRAPRQGGEVVTVAAHPLAITDLAVNATHVFWVDAKQRVFMAPKAPPGPQAR